MEEPVFKNPGNKDQYYNYKEVTVTLESVINAVKEDDSEMAFTILQKGNSLILKRQKIVRLPAILYSLNFLDLQLHIISLQKYVLA